MDLLKDSDGMEYREVMVDSELIHNTILYLQPWGLEECYPGKIVAARTPKKKVFL